MIFEQKPIRDNHKIFLKSKTIILFQITIFFLQITAERLLYSKSITNPNKITAAMNYFCGSQH